MVCHRRAGKTVACIADLICDALKTKKQDALYAYVDPYYKQAKRIAWRYLKRFIADIPGARPNEVELFVELPNGARITLWGADNPDSLRGAYLDGCILDEFADMRPSVWGEVIRPMLADRKGWAAFIGTPKGRTSFYDIYQDAKGDPAWFSLMLKASESGILSAEELEDLRRSMTAEQFAQEFECSFDAAILGAYYGKEIAQAERDGRITEVPYDEAIPVHTAWDLGGGGSKAASATAIWCFQVVNSEIHVIDYIEDHGQPLSHYVRVLNAKGYEFGYDYLPHDARAKELISGRTRVEAMKAMHRDIKVVGNHHVADGINAVKMNLHRVWFDEYKCKDGLEALRQYQTEFDERLNKFKDHPRPDWASHGADAFRYLIMAYREQVHPEKKADPEWRMQAIGDGGIAIHDVDDLADLEFEDFDRPKSNGLYERIR